MLIDCYVEPSPYSCNEAYLIMVDDVFGFVLQVFLLSILKSMFTKEIGLKFSFFVDALCGLGIRLTVVS